MPTGKHKPLRIMDQRPAIPVGGVIPMADPAAAERVISAPDAPTTLALTTGVELREAVYRSYINATWLPPSSFTPATYDVALTRPDGTEYLSIGHSGDADLAGLPQGIHIPNLSDNTSYSVAVRAVSGSGAVSAWLGPSSITTALDTTPPAAVSGLAADFTTPDLVLTWTNPADTDLSVVLISLWASSAKTTQYLTSLPQTATPGSAGRFVWPYASNQLAAGGTGDASIYAEVVAKDGAGNLSSAATVTGTNSAPAAPTGLVQSWSGDTGTASATLAISWTASSAKDIKAYRITIDSVVQPDIVGTGLLYPLDKNRTDHSGTPDPVLDISIVAVDVFGQVSATPLTGTATNAAPPAPTIAGASAPGGEIITILTYTKPGDFDTFEYVYKVGGATEATIYSAEDMVFYRPASSGSYTVTVRARDVFGQYSSAAVSSSITADPLTIASLRAGAAYTDSIGTAAASLAGLKDDLGGSGDPSISYAGASATWKWTEQTWAQEERVKTVTLATGHTTTQLVLGTSPDGTTYTYHYGTLAADGSLPSSTATLATAQAAPFVLPAANTLTRITLASLVPNVRYVRLYHRNTGTNPYTLREFYARRLVESDDIRAEAIQAINISAGAIEAAKIAAGAISAYLISGNTIQTASSGQRVVMSSTGLIGYAADGTTVQWQTDNTTGAITAGGGNVTLSSTGMSVVAGSSYLPQYATDWKVGATVVGSVYGSSASGTYAMTMVGRSNASNHGGATLIALGQTGASYPDASLTLTGGSAGAATATCFISTDTTTIDGGLNVGSATGATTGQIKASGTTTLTAGLNVGSATGATTGQIKASGTVTCAAGLNVGAGSGVGAGQILARQDTSGIIGLLSLENDNTTAGAGVAILLGYAALTSNDYASRIYHTGTPATARSSDLYIQAHGTAAASWAAGIHVQGADGGVILADTNGYVAINSYLDMPEISVSASPAANTLRIYAADSGGTTYAVLRDNGGAILALSATTSTTATAGSNGDVPAQVAGYLKIRIGSTNYKVPYYAA